MEIKKNGFRENKEQAIKTADRLGMALSKIVKTEPKPNHENKNVNTDNISPTENQPSKIEMRKTASLKHHPLNQQIYGDPDPDDDLKTSIQRKGILTPLLISDDDRILSGHRRFLCAKESGIENVPVMVSPLKDELEIEEALINANIQRQKTKEQIAREYMKLKEIEKEKAKQRQAEAGGDRKSDESRKSLTQNSAEAISKGESRKKASSKLGISHDTGEKAAKVVLMADGLKKAGKVDEAQRLLNTLNSKSVNKAHQEAQTIEGKYMVPNQREEKIKDVKSFFVDGNWPPIDQLRKLEPTQLLALRTNTQNQINELFDELNLYQKRLGKISSLINQGEIVRGSEQKAKRGFRDWTEPENNINFCTGCENDCIYCYAKSMAYRFGQVKEGHWHEMIIRQKDVDKKRKLHNGIVGFPSSHDILPTNIDAYLIVLGKLLRAGNEVLIVSKPRLDCIKRICEATQFFKDKILFRFTIGAMNDDILSYWEPNAPTYDERKKCLEYAFNLGFRTSVSMEPMLDTKNIEALVEDLLPFVSEDIWLGTMNHLSRIKKGADKRLLSELEIIEAGQTPEMLLAIDKIYENNPKIKWKTEALKIIEMAKESHKNGDGDRELGELYAKFRSEKSFFGHNPSVLKSGIQKYARRAEVEKGLWCLVEMDMFSLLEWDGPALDAYLSKYPEQNRANTQNNAQRIRTNMVNRLVVMMSEEVNISAWWMPLKIFELYEKWIENRGNDSSRKFMVEMYIYLMSQQMIRLISDLKSVYLIPPDYVKPTQMNDLRQMHNKIQKQYPKIYSGQTEVGEVNWEVDMGKYPTKLKPCINGIIYNLEKGSDHVFYWIRELCDLELKDKLPLKKGKKKNESFKYNYLGIVWDVLHRFIDRNSEYEFVRETICALQEFYKRMTHREKPIYLYHAVLLMVRRKEIDWNSEAPAVDTPADEVEKLYEDHLRGGKMEMDDYVLDLHTKKGKGVLIAWKNLPWKARISKTRTIIFFTKSTARFIFR